MLDSRAPTYYYVKLLTSLSRSVDLRSMTESEIEKCRKRLEQFLSDLLEPLGRRERRHWGAVYVRGLVRGLLTLIEETGDWDWTDRVCFLRRGDKENVSG